MALSNELVYLSDFYAEAREIESSFGITNRYSTHSNEIDQYLGGGFGNEKGYEIVVVFGETGVGKSTVAMNLIADEAIRGTKIGYMLLEDDVRHFVLRMKSIVGEEGLQSIKNKKSIELVPKSMLRELWKLDEILKWIKNKHERGIELFVIDHLQFIFENDIDDSNKSEYNKQRKFMRALNFLLDEIRCTVIIVCHVNKSAAKGMDKIVGSSAISQAGTKVIGVYEVKDGARVVTDQLDWWMHKTRGVERRTEPLRTRRKGYKFFGLEELNETIPF